MAQTNENWLETILPYLRRQENKREKTNKKDYMGVCAVHYFDTEIQLELELLADAIMNHISGAVSSAR